LKFCIHKSKPSETLTFMYVRQRGKVQRTE
jgi:hypothetical protein